MQATPQLPPAIFVMGPTASGKTDLAVSLKKHLPVELISVDSALIYRGMNIGTAKPEPEILAEAPHALIDILDPWESYSVADFYHDALREMQRITEAGRIPLLVGGTMMYFRVLRDGIASLPSANEAVRAQINAEAREFGWPHMHAQLAEIDPVSAERIKPTDPQRLQRALEVYRISGKTLTEFWQAQSSAQKGLDAGKEQNTDYTCLESALPSIPYRIVNLAIAPTERALLHERIALRFELMLQGDFVNEVKELRKNPKIESQMPSMRCVGYRQAWDYLDGLYDYETFKERGIIATRQLAKRQLTWLRGWPDVHWLDTYDTKVIDKALNFIKSAIK